jgi:hypothetical protein
MAFLDPVPAAMKETKMDFLLLLATASNFLGFWNLSLTLEIERDEKKYKSSAFNLMARQGWIPGFALDPSWIRTKCCGSGIWCLFDPGIRDG